MRNSPTLIIFLGPPGAGKGTQAARISTSLGIPAISTGEMLRQAARTGSLLGRTIQKVMDSGQLVGDELINQVVERRLAEVDCELGALLDGYPRTGSQARFLDRLMRRRGLPEPTVLEFQLTAEHVIGRLSYRRQCLECGHIVGIDAAAGDAYCDRDGSLLIQRADDNPAAIRRRLELYNATCADVVGYYRSRDYHKIDATREPDQVTGEVLRALRAPAAAASVLRTMAVRASALA